MIVPDDQLSLAIGKDGLNARLAARLTGWRVDIRSETEFAEEEAEMGYEEEEVAGRCAAILANGKRCPNASLPGSRYCGLPAHQALDDQEGDEIGGEPRPRRTPRRSRRRPRLRRAGGGAPVEEAEPADEEATPPSVAGGGAPAEDEPAVAEAEEAPVAAEDEV